MTKTLTASEVVSEITDHAEKIRAGHERVRPGDPFAFNTAHEVGEGVPQGDLIIGIVAKVPEGYTLVKEPKASDAQLVPGNTEGAKHCLDSLDGVKLYRRDDWGPDSLDGPVIVVDRERVILHPTHGPVTLIPGHVYDCGYQREYDAEQRRERRAAD